MVGTGGLLAENYRSIFKSTQMEQNKHIGKFHEDILEVFASFFTDGNEKKALSILDSE